jgi:uncharacterized protein
VKNNHHPLRLNVGFIVHQPVGYSREFLFDYPQIELGSDLELTSFEGRARISRTPQGLLAQMSIKGCLPAECVRCLTSYHQPLNVDITELYAFSPRTASESNLLMPDDGVIDLEPLVREYMILEIPINTICREDCLGLCPVCGENLNEVENHHHVPDVDPRLAVLQSLLDE